MGHGICGCERNGAVIVRESRLESLELEQRIAAVVVRLMVARVAVERLAVAYDRGSVTPQLEQRVALVVIGVHVIRVERNGLGIARCGRFVARQQVIPVALILVGGGIGGVYQNRLIQCLDGALRVVRLQLDDPEQMQCIEIPRLQLQRLQTQVARLGQPVLPMQGQ